MKRQKTKTTETISQMIIRRNGENIKLDARTISLLYPELKELIKLL
jgi:hypothetical protein